MRIQLIDSPSWETFTQCFDSYHTLSPFGERSEVLHTKPTTIFFFCMLLCIAFVYFIAKAHTHTHTRTIQLRTLQINQWLQIVLRISVTWCIGKCWKYRALKRKNENENVCAHTFCYLIYTSIWYPNGFPCKHQQVKRRFESLNNKKALSVDMQIQVLMNNISLNINILLMCW